MLFAEKHWDSLKREEREGLLKELAESMRAYKPEWWDGKSFTELAELEYDELPDSLKGRLMLASTEDGISVEENIRYQREIDRMFGTQAI